MKKRYVVPEIKVHRGVRSSFLAGSDESGVKEIQLDIVSDKLLLNTVGDAKQSQTSGWGFDEE